MPVNLHMAGFIPNVCKVSRGKVPLDLMGTFGCASPGDFVAVLFKDEHQPDYNGILQWTARQPSHQSPRHRSDPRDGRDIARIPVRICKTVQRPPSVLMASLVRDEIGQERSQLSGDALALPKSHQG